MTSQQIRQSFLDFFKNKNHHIVNSAPVVPQDDPTLLFTNAGMNQFKDIFLGLRPRQWPRVADSQKCIRVSGKHNDLEEVGRDTYHHTFFEMLGNWSFGDYFKAEAIEWAWELLTDVWHLPADRLYATIFAGDEMDQVPGDEEAAEFWASRTSIDPSHILRFSKKDNFWEMGDAGPCGPCSEIHIDRGEGFCDSIDPNHVCGVNSGCARFIELWNLVFIQYNRDDQGALHPLPAKHVDTGAGFERVVSVLQNVRSNYDTDLFAPIIASISRITGKSYSDGEEGVAFRVLSDHVRALSFAIADGAIPGNEGRGYVLRRILRRAARFGRTLGMHEPFIHKLVQPLVTSMGDAYPELRERQPHIERVIRAEEESFGRNLDRGIEIFEEKVATSRNGMLSGSDAFLLHDTYGFPLDLTQLMAEERGLTVDIQGFDQEMEKQRQRSTRSRDGSYATIEVDSGMGEDSRFMGYTHDQLETELVHYEPGRIVLKESPFYAESGGQVGDSGEIRNAHFHFAVETTKSVGAHIVHFGQLTAGTAPVPGDRVEAKINVEKRRATERNHTVTHLLHHALRTVLGEHVHQAGSLVAPDYVRFDFTHFEKVGEEQLRTIETIVNQEILRNRPVHWQVMPIEQAKALGAMALFGEKYSDQVRMVEVQDFSRELCGGTHVRATGEIGLFILRAESAIAAGVRRLEGLTGQSARDYLLVRAAVVARSSALLGCREEEVADRLERLLQERKNLEGELRKLRQSSSRDLIGELVQGAKEVAGIRMVAAQIEAANVDELKEAADLLREGLQSGVGILATAMGDKVQFICVVTRDLVETRKLKAGDLVREVAAVAGGSGGGSPHMALAGARDPGRIADALNQAERILAGIIDRLESGKNQDDRL
ncbi:MAG TPA: alanine--tRNA ligase [bacterium]|nr:alanine--tRNA ligase [bacterium]HQI47324.1 alanine--tRNA ligase [bacterium]HQJ63401.1 alanine--tRNA ligase [bacterium]